MCDTKHRRTLSDTLENLRKPVPYRHKIRLVLRNNWLKLRTRSDCCGNHGEPGC